VDPYADDLFANVISRAIAVASTSPYIGLDPNSPDIHDWLTDSMKTLIIQILDKDPSVDPGVQASLLSDLQQLETEEGIDQGQSASLQAEQILKVQSTLLAGMANVMSSFSDGIKAFQQATGGFQRAGAIFDSVVNKIGAKGMFRMKGVATVAMV
jgi:hypothetical protein